MIKYLEISQDIFSGLTLEIENNKTLVIIDSDFDSVGIDKTGAKELIKVLQEFVDENQD